MLNVDSTGYANTFGKLPNEVFIEILTSLSFKDLSALQRTCQNLLQRVPNTYLAKSSHVYKLISKLSAKQKEESRISKFFRSRFSFYRIDSWRGALQAAASTMYSMDFTCVAKPSLLPEYIAFFPKVREINLSHSRFKAEDLRRCSFPRTIEKASLFYDDKYRWRITNSLSLPFAINKITFLELKHNDPFPSCNFSNMRALKMLKIRAPDLTIPIVFPPSLKCLEVKSNSLASQKLLKQIAEQRLPLEELSLSKLLLNKSTLSLLSMLNCRLTIYFIFIPFLESLKAECQGLIASEAIFQSHFSLLLENYSDELYPQIDLPKIFWQRIQLLHLNSFSLNKTLLQSLKEMRLKKLILERPLEESTIKLIEFFTDTLEHLCVYCNGELVNILSRLSQLNSLELTFSSSEEEILFELHPLEQVTTLKLINCPEGLLSCFSSWKNLRQLTLWYVFIDKDKAMMHKVSLEGFTFISSKRQNRIYEIVFERQ